MDVLFLFFVTGVAALNSVAAVVEATAMSLTWLTKREQVEERRTKRRRIQPGRWWHWRLFYTGIGEKEKNELCLQAKEMEYFGLHCQICCTHLFVEDAVACSFTLFGRLDKDTIT